MDIAKAAVLQKTTLFFENDVDKESLVVKGYDFNTSIKEAKDNSTGQVKREVTVDYDALFTNYRNIGFQATSIGRGIEEINRMVCSYLMCLLYI
jgi:hypothetical protein